MTVILHSQPTMPHCSGPFATSGATCAGKKPLILRREIMHELAKSRRRAAPPAIAVVEEARHCRGGNACWCTLTLPATDSALLLLLLLLWSRDRVACCRRMRASFGLRPWCTVCVLARKPPAESARQQICHRLPFCRAPATIVEEFLREAMRSARRKCATSAMPCRKSKGQRDTAARPQRATCETQAAHPRNRRQAPQSETYEGRAHATARQEQMNDQLASIAHVGSMHHRV